MQIYFMHKPPSVPDQPSMHHPKVVHKVQTPLDNSLYIIFFQQCSVLNHCLQLLLCAVVIVGN